MPVCRKNDVDRRTWFRSSRLFRQEALWYFSTREGTVEGPFVDDVKARDKIDAFVRQLSPQPALGTRAFAGAASHEKRNRKEQVPKDLSRVLSDLQLLGLKAVEDFGWAVAFVRRPLFQDAVVVVASPDGKQLGILDEDGKINRDYELMLRH